MKKRFFVLLIVTLFVFLMPMQVFAAKPAPVVKAVEYVGLGDSIAYGMSATSPDLNYFSKYSAYLDAKTSSPYYSSNPSQPGLTCGELLDELDGTAALTAARTDLPGATVVTVCIGGNNLLGPLIDYVADLYGIPTNDPDFLQNLSAAINADPDRLTNDLAWQIIWPFSELRQDLQAGVNAFKADWPAIVPAVKTLSGMSPKVYVLTVYNPVYGNSTLRDFMDGYITQINTAIKNYASSQGYTVVDIYARFSSYTGTEPLVGFNLSSSPATFDPHPTDAGHEVIYNALVAASGRIKK